MWMMMMVVMVATTSTEYQVLITGQIWGKLFIHTIFTSYNSCALVSAVQVKKLRICVLK